MCNRYSINERKAQLESVYGRVQAELLPRYNIAPTQMAPIARVMDGNLRLEDLRWGFENFNGQPVMNARSETASEKRMFREAWKAQHCIVPCDGFYEWKNTPEGKQPYRFVRKDRSIYWFAGLWTEDRFTILTATAQGCVAGMHDRMPVILREEAIDWWLARETRAAADIIGQAVPPDECYPVTRLMSNARHVTPDCIEPITIAQQELKF